MTTKQQVTGIGGIFFKARDPETLAAWYHEHLGVPVEAGQTYAMLTGSGADERTVWSVLPEDTTYFAPSTASFMINFRVADLDAMLEQLRAAGVDVDDRVEEYDYGRFSWAADPEGNRFELWEPAGGGA